LATEFWIPPGIGYTKFEATVFRTRREIGSMNCEVTVFTTRQETGCTPNIDPTLSKQTPVFSRIYIFVELCDVLQVSTEIRNFLKLQDFSRIKKNLQKKCIFANKK